MRRRGDKVGKSLSLIITIYRHFRSANVDKMEEMKG